MAKSTRKIDNNINKMIRSTSLLFAVTEESTETIWQHGIVRITDKMHWKKMPRTKRHGVKYLNAMRKK